MLLLSVGGAGAIQTLSGIMGRLLGLQYGRDPFVVLRAASIESMILILPFLGTALALGVGTSLLQGGFVLKPFEIKFDDLSPLKGLKRIFSVNGLAEALKTILKFTIAGLLFYSIMKRDLAVLPALTDMDLRSLAAFSGSLVMKAIAYGFLWFLFFGVADFFIERWRFERSLRMSRQEIKEEFKESEGNPAAKSRMRSIQRELARRRMMQEVPKATVVITNPTHIAVALRYEEGRMKAPTVVAKGAEIVAEKIKEVARTHQVPIVEDKPLARLLFKVDLGASIPEDLYRAVAKVLAYIYRMKGNA